ncbi:hypothetical protein M3923_002157 [Vibrio metschnikovii]|uniref:hypothetical protein n=1 Tax=Vibrio metschnikovii TaxID=28172 RepID=UPI002A43747D|nr:hypothetical protein [Vibrio metschnikovii]EKO3602453.1 hypothetical protein [Vibrio metschnikovii]EKO3618184.1 hypothetical protein [Vibrio metschnikovii]EKO3655303.1 hypothetical protein [Vibrio metschnikovii]EKO3673495.1 hypothetical protein [Vibrio metschnikovii]
MTLTEKQQAAMEIFNSRNNIRSLDLTLNDLETLRDRISFIIEELSNEQELKNVEAAIQNYNNENGTSLTKKDFKTDDAVEKVD